MRDTKEFFNHYWVVNDLQGIAEDVRKAVEVVKEVKNELKKED